ncbi:hypothetical protein K9L05_03965 [Candidatus Babeliales bacterium]|nr:hypothetical protein [Candidatus Babeliales bacterium]MCF7899773.1 hypothetical protein [Candidatus Babeliales bacterium]
MEINLNLSEIKKYIDPKTYERGADYYSQNMVHSIIKTDNSLKGKCSGI